MIEIKRIFYFIICSVLIYLSYNGLPLLFNNIQNLNNVSVSALLNKCTTIVNKEREPINEIKDNKDIVGKLIIPRTKINYPIVKTTNNKYYLSHDILFNKSVWGSIFMDYRNNGTGLDKNTIIYGHNMKDGTMLTGIVNYKDKNFFDANKYIYFDALDKQIKWQVFSAYVTDTSFNYIKTQFKSTDDFSKFLKSIQHKSKFSSNVEVNENDHILTLSTCSYEFKNAKFVVHAKCLSN